METHGAVCCFQVKVWFQNRRIKWRRQNLEREQARLARLSRRTDSPPSSGHELPQLERAASPSSAAERHSPAAESLQLEQHRPYAELQQLPKLSPPAVTES